tara:strand:- start:9377 stop:11083 length:1707 start_codon:yes stop_codon:yes gene_type:complete
MVKKRGKGQLNKILSFGKKVLKKGKKVNVGKVFGNRLVGGAQGVKGKEEGKTSGVKQSKVRTKSLLGGIAKMLQPPEKQVQGQTMMVNRLVTQKFNTLASGLKQSVAGTQQQPFDPKAFLGQIFQGGLGSLNQFASGLNGLQGSLQKNILFLNQAKGIIVDVIEKMAKAKRGKPKTGFFKGLIGGIVKLGMAGLMVKMLAPKAAAILPTLGKAALGVGLAVGAGFLAKKFLGIGGKKDQIRGQNDIDVEAFNDTTQTFADSVDFFYRMIRLNQRKKQEEEEGQEEEGQEEESQVEGKEGDTTVEGVEEVDTPQVETKVDGTENLTPNADLKLEDSGAMTITPLMGEKKGDESETDEEAKSSVSTPKSDIVPFDTQSKNKRGQYAFNSETVLNKEVKGKDGEDGVGLDGATGGSNLIQNTGSTFFFDANKFAKSLEKPGNAKIEVIKSTSAPRDPNAIDQDLADSDVTGTAMESQRSTVEGSKETLDAKKVITNDISKPAKSSDTTGGEGAGTPSVIPIPAGSERQNKNAPIQRVRNKQENKVPMLPAFRIGDIHTQNARSVFNIVDAI